MVKILTSLGLMSGTSGDGVDASIIKSNGEIESNDKNVLELVKDKFFEYDKKTISKIHSLRDKINFYSKIFHIHKLRIRLKLFELFIIITNFVTEKRDRVY